MSDIKDQDLNFYNVGELKCPLCLSAVDTEIHFVLCCPVVDDLRYEFIKPNISITHVNFGWHCS